MAHWVGVQGQIKLAKNIPPLWPPPREPQIQNEKILFSISTRRLAESVSGLNSFLDKSSGEL